MRHENWPDLLADRLKAWRDVPFVWGQTDCVSFVVDVVNAISDANVIVRRRGEYKTEREALRQIRSFGADLAELVTLRFGASRHPNYAQRGDVVMSAGNLGICDGSFGLFMTEVAGLTHISIADCLCCWKVE